MTAAPDGGPPEADRKGLGHALYEGLGYVGGVILAAMTAAVFFQVMMRFAGQSPVDGIDEIPRYLFVWLVMIGAASAMFRGEHTVLDWIAALEAPTLLVVGSYLGALSHSLTAHAALAARGVRMLAVVISQSPEEPVPTAETAASLRRFVGPTPVLILPRDEKASAAELAALVLKEVG